MLVVLVVNIYFTKKKSRGHIKMISLDLPGKKKSNCVLCTLPGAVLSAINY